MSLALLRTSIPSACPWVLRAGTYAGMTNGSTAAAIAGDRINRLGLGRRVLSRGTHWQAMETEMFHWGAVAGSQSDASTDKQCGPNDGPGAMLVPNTIAGDPFRRYHPVATAGLCTTLG